MDDSFFGALFDFSFSSFVTTRIIKVLYIIGLILLVLGGLIMILFGFIQGGMMSGIVSLIAVPIGVFIYILLLRVWLELMIVVFTISDDLKRLADKS